MEITFVDLFGGAGGWSVGMESVGWNHLALFDINESACRTASHNFACDVHNLDLSSRKAVQGFVYKPTVLVGSPPCQGFSNEGKKNQDDPRNNLVWKFFDIVDKCDPDVWIFENVPGFKNSYNGIFFEALKKRLDNSTYQWNSWILNAADYGVPQYRKRFVAIGSKRFVPQMPSPTHVEDSNVLFGKKHVTLWEAISDLPTVELGDRIGIFKYPSAAETEYQKLMRRHSRMVYNHTCQKHSPRVLEKIGSIAQGESMQKLIGKFEENKVAYCGGYRRAYKHTPSYTAYWTRGMTSIHPVFDRFLTPRECARIQSFPDRFVFQGSTIENYTQICNAVPPLLARAIGESVTRQLTDTTNASIEHSSKGKRRRKTMSGIKSAVTSSV